MLDSWTLTSILDKLEDLSVSKVCKYNKQETINFKPSLSAGNEELEEYDCALKLHASFCSPQRIIDVLEKQQQSREAFEWIYRGAYKGSFVIERLETQEIFRVKDVLICADLKFKLIEKPQNEEFMQQITGSADLTPYEQFQEGSNRLKEFAKTVKNSIMENLKNAVMNVSISENLSDAAYEIFSNVKNGVINDISKGSITGIYDKIRDYSDIIEHSNLNVSDIRKLLSDISQIPALIMRAAI